ncbi:GNAT family N-acetyltransferase [Streptomyces lunaelactis]|uniref:GNAT family N-acetyltransferase n=1 Tax=Streptomyces lunaelactis TaxID=1535768 RepID=UPI0015859A68|nr:GNAT family N-acetyltransferase [Streptomyces lunaelactis]NUK06950.1 GNAT family N-acetyltransferase [Streptomyces lunaelactis]NUK33134.1 GNAT family N-acetyltransferase [Streptomyces lunaelactis]NUK40699.1 GNAT family N-acetyltransferase [Streptomyces lunaelactis]NUK52330.1 GNAT family N-acetyltransferase [Streptomyces lunaelactis]NUK60413.1 GNAT family N-acetyltransferase [Streptomyces lunaelactis]
MHPLGEAPQQRSTSRATTPATTPTAVDAAGLTVTRASLGEWHQVVEWAAEEGWNPGSGDAACFHPTDPAGFFVGRLGTRTVSAVSVVNYSEQFAFLGYYLVHPDLRRQGLGLATWRAAVPHAGDRTIGLDAVPAQEDTYRRSGFTSANNTIRYGGRPERSGTSPAGVVPLATAQLEAIAAYDRQCFPTERRAFVGRWLTAAGHTTYIRQRDGNIAGYGVIRPSRDGHRIGPLFADTREDAEALFDALTAQLGPDEKVCLDIPEPRQAACALATARGLTPQFHTVRMYTAPVPQNWLDRTYGVTSLELG